MTIVEQITQEAKALSKAERQKALHLIKSIRARTQAERATSSTASKRRIDKRKLHPALRAIAGMWNDRKDLPREGAAASAVLRRRLMGRDTHA